MPDDQTMIPSLTDIQQQPLVAAYDLTLVIDGNRLIDQISFTLDSQSRTIILGPNGAGKSLLLKLMHGLITPTDGAVRWQEQPGGGPRRQAMVFQRPVLLRRSVAANLDFVLKRQGKTDITDRREALLNHIGLGERGGQPARLLSVGEQQRLALARALATEPEILFLDEATASLDPASVLKIEEIVQEVSAAGVKIVFVTHDLGQARRLADDVLFLHRGQIAEQAAAGEFFRGPDSPAAAAFLDGRIVI